MGLTFVIGMVIGVFIPGVIWRLRSPGIPPQEMRNAPLSSENRFERMLYRIVSPDSSQIEKIRPLARQTSARIDSIQHNANAHIKDVIDSLNSKLQPILTTDQFKRLNDFGDRMRNPRRGDSGAQGGPGGRPDRGYPGDKPDVRGGSY